MANYAEWKAYVGPHYLDYDWSVHDEGAADDLDYGTTLNATLSSGATECQTDGATGFVVNNGGIWIKGNGTNEGWEYCGYSSVTGVATKFFHDLVREPANGRDHNGNHSNGAEVYQFVKIIGNNGILQFDAVTDDETKQVATWTATISGARFQQVIRNGHLCIVQRRTDTTSSFMNALVGFIDTPDVTDDARRHGEWNFTIVSIAGILSNVRAAGVRAGEFNTAITGSASADSTLTQAYEERNNGDFTAANPVLDPSSAIDSDTTTLWIGDRFLGLDNLPAVNTDPYNDDLMKFTQIFVNPPAGAPPGSRWFEITRVTAGNVRGLALFAANGGSSYVDWLFGGPGEVEAGARFIFCEDTSVFTALHPTAEYVAIYEKPAFFTHLLPTGGEIWLRLGALNAWLSHVIWGDANGFINHPDAPNESYTPTITAPAFGETMYYSFLPNHAEAADYWTTGFISHAGYEMDEDNESWFMVDLPGLGLVLETDITNTVPGNGDLLRIVDEAGNANTGGLDDSGTLQIADEQITYSAKASNGVIVTARGANGTTAAAHDAQDIIYFLDADDVATDAPALSRITLKWGGDIIGEDYLMYVSSLPDAVRNPDADGWASDWNGFNTLVGNTDATQNNFIDPSMRIKHILIVFTKMSEIPARARLSELIAVLDETKYGANAALPAGTVAGDIIEQVLLNAGMPAGMLTHSGTPALDQVQTAADSVWAVVADFADFAGLKLKVGRDSKLVIVPSTLWTSTQTPSLQWGRTTAKNARATWVNGAGVSQAVVHWRSPDGTEKGAERYPEEQTANGSPIETKELIYANATAAQTAARRRYFSARYPSAFLVECAGDFWSSYATDVDVLNWQFDPEHPNTERVSVITRATHRIEKRIASSALELVQIQHESDA